MNLYRFNVTNTCEAFRAHGADVEYNSKTGRITASIERCRVILRPCDQGLYGIEDIKRALAKLRGFQETANQSK
jgi:anti-sigma regulatory factor (Ser/Thr protein kinase)